MIHRKGERPTAVQRGQKWQMGDFVLRVLAGPGDASERNIDTKVTYDAIVRSPWGEKAEPRETWVVALDLVADCALAEDFNDEEGANGNG